MYKTSISIMIFKAILIWFLFVAIIEMVFRLLWRSFGTQLFQDLDSCTHVDRASLQDWSIASHPGLYRDKCPVAINSLYKCDSPDAAATSSRTTEINLSVSDLDRCSSLRKSWGESSFVIDSPQLIKWQSIRVFFPCVISYRPDEK